MRRSGLAFAALTALLATMPAAVAAGFADAPGGTIRWLDKLSGETGTAGIQRGQTLTFGRLAIRLDSCRYPEDNPAAEAEAHLTILDTTRNETVFSGWMLASSPGLSAMERPRYDVWVLRCDVPGYAPPESATEDGADDGAPEDSGEAGSDFGD